MKKVLITFSGARYHETTRHTVEDGPRLGADEVLVYDDHWLFRQAVHIEATKDLIYPGNRGLNWFAWKPYVILDALSRVGDGDVVFYVDGDTYPVANLGVLYDITLRDGIMLFMANGWPEQKVWCKRACFVIMNQDQPQYHTAHCGCARFMGFTHRHIDFLKVWLGYCTIRDCTTFDIDPRFGPELPGFREHRCEQAILTNLAHKYNHRLYRECDDSGEKVWPDNGGSGQEDLDRDRDLFPQLFQQVYANVLVFDLGQGSEFRNV
jgi:hypothetical protein